MTCYGHIGTCDNKDRIYDMEMVGKMGEKLLVGLVLLHKVQGFCNKTLPLFSPIFLIIFHIIGPTVRD